MIDKVFLVRGNKISTLVVDDDSLKFSSATFKTVEDFTTAFAKKLSLSTKLQIKYDSIKSIRKEDNDKDVWIKYRTYVGLAGNCVFSFTDTADYETFFNFFQKEKHYSKTQETLAPFKAISNYLVGLIITIAIAIFMYYQAIEITNGTVEEAHSGNARAFDYIVGLLGKNGVLFIGALITGYLLYKIWTRFTHPPLQVKLLPPNV